jgi:phosphoadenosine phosphosulfate reductase
MSELSELDQLVILADNFERSYPHEIIAWASHNYGDGLVMATGFGPEGIVILHIVHQVAPEIQVFYLDTDLLFPETYQLRDRLEQRFGIGFTRVATALSVDQQNEQVGPELWSSQPDRCCRLRKVEPLRAFLKDKKAWITGIRRDQTAHRASAKPIEWDAGNGLVKINPLINWSQEQVWTYIHLFELPYNELHHKGYPSIGCAPCTRPVAEGADPRSGRWVGREKVECGIHLQDEE